LVKDAAAASRAFFSNRRVVCRCSKPGEFAVRQTVMTLVQWKDHYSVGAGSIDGDHKALIERINELYDRLMAEDGPSVTTVFFDGLIRAITLHFALEERYMREHGYALLPQHREDFERLLDEIHGLIDEFDRSDGAGRADLAALLDGWLSSHFETHDARLGDGLGPRPN
jgi:hemerythrin